MFRTLKNLLNGIFFISMLFFTALTGGVFIMGPSFILLFVNENWFRWYNDFAVRLWLILPGALLELMFGTKLVITGEKVDSNDCPLIIMNHRCRLDYMFYWMVLLRNGRLANEKIIMKHELKYFPALGWAMQNLMYFFLNRRWEQDKLYLDRMLDYFEDIKYPLQLFVFPEGTNLFGSAIKNSDKFADKMNLVKYKYCLHPRVTGFNYFVQKLRHKTLDSIHDVTVAYPGKLCYGELDILRGKFPGEIHVHVTRYNMKDIPIESEQINKWCQDRFEEKEERLKHFYEKGCFENEPVHYTDKRTVDKANIVMVTATMFWATFLLLTLYLVVYYTIFRWYALVMMIFYFAVNIILGGTDELQLIMHKWHMDKVKK